MTHNEIGTETVETIRAAKVAMDEQQRAAYEAAMQRAHELDAQADAAWAVVGMLETSAPRGVRA